MTELVLDKLKLQKGSHAKRGHKSVCVMEAVAWFAGLEHTDRPDCTDTVVASYAMALNDKMPSEQRQRLIPYIPRLAGTKNGASKETRAFMCADRALGVFAPLALDAKFPKQAAKLRALNPIVDEETAEKGRAAANAAANAAAAAYAANAAAYAAYAAAAYDANAAAYDANDVWDEAFRLLDDLIGVGRE